MGTILDHRLNKEVPLTESRMSSKSFRQNKVTVIILRKTNPKLLLVTASTFSGPLRSRKGTI